MNFIISTLFFFAVGFCFTYLVIFAGLAIIAPFQFADDWAHDKMFLTLDGLYQDKWDILFAKAYMAVAAIILGFILFTVIGTLVI